jgi:hypothetical protein
MVWGTMVRLTILRNTMVLGTMVRGTVLLLLDILYYILSWSKVTNPGKILYWVPYVDVDVYLHSNLFIGAYPYL